MKTLLKSLAIGALAFALAGVLADAALQSYSYTEAMYSWPVHDTDGNMIQAPEQIPGGEAHLLINASGAIMVIHGHGLPPGEAITSWWVIFNDPSQCTDGVCGEDDVFEHPELSNVSVLLGQGRVSDERGKAFYIDGLMINDTSGAYMGPGLLNPHGAEIHLALRSHGVAQADILDEQLGSLNGGCDPEPPHAPCKDLQFAIFKQN